MTPSDIDTRPFSNPLRRNLDFDVRAHRAIIERDALEVENAALSSQLAKAIAARDELEKRAHTLGNRCMIAEGQRDVLHDALGIALMGGKDGELAWAREVYRRTQAGDDIGVLMSNIQRMAAEIRRHKAAATGDTR